MKDEELRKLKGIIVPPPSEKAKQRAISNTIQSFDTYQSKTTKKKSQAVPSGFPLYGFKRFYD